MKASLGRFLAGGLYAVTGPALLAAGVVLASHHPTAPWLALAGFALWFLIALRWSSVWLFILPACLPAAGFAPWTGWIAFDEFDLVVIGALTAGHASTAWRRFGSATAAAADADCAFARPLLAVAVLCASAGLLAVARALLAVDSPTFGWYDGEVDPINALRVGKSELYALLLLPLLHPECLRSKTNVFRHVSAGMLVGLSIVGSAVLWERAAYPGLFELSKGYRTVALFWEMHLGGAAIDAYLAMAVPFVVAAVVRARTALRFAASALLAVVAEYACLTTFSRGLYLALAVSLVVFAMMVARRPIEHAGPPWREPAKRVLLIILIGQMIAVLGSDSFMLSRIERGGHDLRSRLAHWSRGLDLLHGAPDWWLGKGMGRLPAEFAASDPPVETSGQARVVQDEAEAFLELRGPRSNDALAGLYALSQRIPLEPMSYRATLDVRTDRATRLGIAVCEVHLLYEGECRRAFAAVPASGRRWQHLTLALAGSGQPASESAPRLAVFSLTVVEAAGVIEIDKIALTGDGARNVLHNADFSHGLAHWYPMAKEYFIPWHIDSLALELLIEQGIAGLVAFALLMAFALAALFCRRSRDTQPATLVEPVLAASLVGALLVGLFSSVLDMPRVAFLLFFLAFVSIRLAAAPSSRPALPRPAGRGVLASVK